MNVATTRPLLIGTRERMHLQYPFGTLQSYPYGHCSIILIATAYYNRACLPCIPLVQ